MHKTLKYTAETRAKWLSEGRGQGEGGNYKGWLTIHDVSGPLATKTRLIEGCHNRMCHLLSKIERRLFLYYDFSPFTIALYDQYRLDIEETLEIAKSLGIDHPRVPNTGEYWDITTDLVMQMQIDEKIETWPRSCKPEKHLNDYNNIEHAQIESVWWRRRGSTLKFSTEKDPCIPNTLAENLEIINPTRFLHDDPMPYDGYMNDMKDRMLHAIFNQQNACTLSEFCSNFNAKNGTYGNDALRLALHFIYRSFIHADLFSSDIRKQNILDIKTRTAIHSNSVKKRFI